MKRVQDALSSLGIPVFAGVWKATADGVTPPLQYLVYTIQTYEDEHWDDATNVMHGFKSVGELDYVVGWYKKAMDLMQDTHISTAFVSTNSICQGQQATALWETLFSNGIYINFAHRTFRWDSEASIKAHVHCIIVGFSYNKSLSPRLFDSSGNVRFVDNINQYLTDAPTVIIESRSEPLCAVPYIRFGSMPRDGGGFILSESEKDELIVREPLSKQCPSAKPLKQPASQN